MKRDNSTDLVELGCASEDTLGGVYGEIEAGGLRPKNGALHD